MKKLTAFIIALFMAFGAVALTSCVGREGDGSDTIDGDYETINNEGWSHSFEP